MGSWSFQVATIRLFFFFFAAFHISSITPNSPLKFPVASGSKSKSTMSSTRATYPANNRQIPEHMRVDGTSAVYCYGCNQSKPRVAFSESQLKKASTRNPAKPHHILCKSCRCCEMGICHVMSCLLSFLQLIMKRTRHSCACLEKQKGAWSNTFH